MSDAQNAAPTPEPQRPAPGQQIVRRATPGQATNDNWLVGVLSEGRVMIGRQRARVDDFLPDVEAISERRHSPFATLMVVVLFAMVMAAAVWMAVSKIDQVASAPAVVRPTGKAKVINHGEGGRVAEILVKEGQDVKRDDVLVRFEHGLVDQEIAKYTALYIQASGEAARLEAETEGKPLTFPSDLQPYPQVRNDQESLFRARKDAIESRRASADADVLQTEARANGIADRITGVDDSLKLLREQATLLKPVVDKDYFSKIRYMSILRDLAEQEGLLKQQQRELVAARQVHQAALQKRVLIDREWHAENYLKRTQITAERDRYKAWVDQQNLVKANLVIRAPEAGTVKDLRALSVGQAFRPGEPVLGIVPADEVGLEVEARVGNSDIGSVHMGQAVTLKFTAYDWIRYGVLQGKVTHIDRDATNPATDESGQTRATAQPYFRVIIHFDKDPNTGAELTKLNREGTSYGVTAGMSAIAELHIGERTILEFFTDRIFAGVQGSFREK